MTHPQLALTAEQIGQIREDLLRALAKLERSMKTSGEAARPVELDQSCIGRLSRIEALQNQGFAQKLQQREQVQFAQISGALRRIEEGSFGACGNCGGPIRYERLLIFPETLTCAPCGQG